MMNTFLLSILMCVVGVQGGVSTLPNKQYWGYRAKNCTPKVRKNLCTDCLLIESNIDPKDGEFWDINRVYNVEDEVCQAAIAEYNEDNPCDEATNKCLPQWLKNPKDEKCRQKLDRMLYTVCELCCDCIPLGAKPNDYTLDVTRPNCGLHAKADNCNYYDDMHDDICQAIDKRNKNKIAQQKTYAWLEEVMVEYNCLSKPLWDVCYMMEKGQGRLKVSK